MSKWSSEVKEECLRLRHQYRMSSCEISAKTGVPKGTVGVWLKETPLTVDEIREKIVSHHLGKPTGKKKDRGEVSKYFNMVDVNALTRQDKGKIAESAILFRLCLMGFIVYGSPFDGDKADWLIESTDNIGKTYRVQVKWTKEASVSGLPMISLLCMEKGKSKRYKSGDFDFIIGYCLFNDTAYVYSFDEVKHLKSCLSVTQEASEAWDKIKKPVSH